MKFPNFGYACPSSLADALHILRDDKDARVLAGGQSLLPMMALRLAAPSVLVDLGALDELRQIELGEFGVRIGAMVTHDANASSDVVSRNVPLLAEALKHVAHQAVRNRGTIGGSIANADAAAEMPAVAVVLNATMTLQNCAGSRNVAATEFFLGHYTTAAEPDELLTHITFPPSNLSCAFEEVARRPGDYALALAAVGIQLDSGVCRTARIVVGSISDKPLRSQEAESFLVGKQINLECAQEAGRIALSNVRVRGDIHASPDFRTSLATKLVTKALIRATEEAV
jgi:carbon-monoxide dehydrogenase medium subunit